MLEECTDDGLDSFLALSPKLLKKPVISLKGVLAVDG
jgi:hypothetical protein